MASVAHELRTPLNGSIGFLESAIEEDRIPQECKAEYIQPAVDCSNYLLCLINDILDFSQLNVQKLRLNFSCSDLGELVDETVSLIKFSAEKKNLTLIKHIDENLPQIIWTDRNRLKQVLLNLLGNAVKFTYEGSISLRVTMDGDVISFSVRDTGIGIKTEDFDKLFKAFGTLHNGKGLNPNGVGLGLMISSAIVRMLGGDEGILFSSTFGEGSEFKFKIRINLPRKSAREQTVRESDSINIAEFHDIETLRNYQKNRHIIAKPFLGEAGIKKSTQEVEPRTEERNTDQYADAIIVDDNQFNIETLKKLLQRELGFKSDSAYHGKMVIDHLLQTCGEGEITSVKGYKVIFMDSDMPVMDGLETTRRLRALMEDGKIPRLLIIGCTAHSFPEEIERCLMAGMDDCITKPVSRHALRELAEKWGNFSPRIDSKLSFTQVQIF
eukprot:TRINITY_DN10882_c0_g1_i2.p1 TRINITY_DN10882_c0_g1~~TRINITY_DN10882_c0_g1_i2.p1  ORF type:complete len:440 (-),score=53.74 TRINITY_DN10882_c0_g1_i2:27-1346(-)